MKQEVASKITAARYDLVIGVHVSLYIMFVRVE